jgi:hypothetical protein
MISSDISVSFVNRDDDNILSQLVSSGGLLMQTVNAGTAGVSFMLVLSTGSASSGASGALYIRSCTSKSGNSGSLLIGLGTSSSGRGGSVIASVDAGLALV